MEKEEIKYIEEEIKNWKRRISHEHFQIVMHESHNEALYGREAIELYLVHGLQFLYFLILSYIESKGLLQYANHFKESFSPILSDDKALLESGFLDPEGEPELIVLHKYSQFLSPFKAFDYKTIEKEENEKLLELLKSTPYILKNTKTKITNETSIYQEVFWVLKLYYQSCRRKNKASFIQQFKVYNPDILIPELKTSIEYKFIRKGTNIEEFIDQVKVDSINYKDDYRYDNFIAVLCIEDCSIATEENIQSAWKVKEFPKNWNLIITFLQI